MAVEIKQDLLDQDVTIVKGTLNRIYLNELREIKTYDDWTPTHSVRALIDTEDWVNLGLTDKKVIRCKDKDGEYHDLVKGTVVQIQIDKVEQYEGKTQYSTKSSLVTILNRDNVAKTTEEGKTEYSKPYDPIPVQLGNSLTIAANFKDARSSYTSLLEFCKDEVYPIVIEFQDEIKELYPDLSPINRGSRAGQCLVIVSQRVKKLSDLKATATKLFTALTNVEKEIRGDDPTPVSNYKETKRNEDAEEELSKVDNTEESGEKTQEVDKEEKKKPQETPEPVKAGIIEEIEEEIENDEDDKPFDEDIPF